MNAGRPGRQRRTFTTSDRALDVHPATCVRVAGNDVDFDARGTVISTLSEEADAMNGWWRDRTVLP